MGALTESALEEQALSCFASLGYDVAAGADLGAGERARLDDAFLPRRLRAALVRLNPALPDDAIDEAFRKATVPDSPSLQENNHRFHRVLTEGVDVLRGTHEGVQRYGQARLIDFDHPDRNDWLAVNQLSMVEGQHVRRADVVVYVNGLPLAVFELKNPGSETASAQTAYNQLRTYQAQIPALFHHNEVLVASDGLDARAGTLGAPWEAFLPWKTIEGDERAPRDVLPLEVLIRGLFDRRRFLQLLQGFIVFESDGNQTIKKMARYHQFHAVQRAIDCTIGATRPGGDRKVGVVWHTQGSGKSLTMAFYAGCVVRHPDMANPSLVVLTDRNDLDDQLFGTFSHCHELLRQQPVQAADREHLKSLLRVPSGGVIFTTIQKFQPEPGQHYPCLSDRANIVVICDEAHRSQYDFIDGYARHLRNALPNASHIAFTGTPVELVGKNTRAVFGDYIDVYDIRQSVDDRATVPIYYEGRLIELSLREEDRELLDEEFDDVTEAEEQDDRERLKTRWSRLEALVGARERVAKLAEDLVSHFEQRREANGGTGKGMVVCMSRRICVDLYDAIARLRPGWAAEADDAGSMKVVMTGSASDPPEWQQHIRSKGRREGLAGHYKKPDDPFCLVIVRDMWLTGFDAPCMHTMYLDKPMQGHGLMQAIARCNRVFADKPGGLIVDFLGLADNLRKALQAYSTGDRDSTGIDQSAAIGAMLEEFHVVCAMMHGFDYSACRGKPLSAWLPLVNPAMDHVLSLPAAPGEEEPRRRFLAHVSALSKAYALSVPSEEALEIRDEVGFFQLVRAALVKTTGRATDSPVDVEAAVQQLVSRAVISGDVVDIFAEAGLSRPDISTLSDQFLAEVKGMQHKSLAAEALRKLLEGQVRAREKHNPLEARSFAKLLEEAMLRYRNRSIEAAQVIEELIELAKQMREAAGRGERMGLSDDELAFYDALAQNESAVEVMGDDQLRLIAREVLQVVRENATIDWAVRESTRAKLRVIVKRVLRKHGYPPDMQESAAQTVIEQAEALCDEWVPA